MNRWIAVAALAAVMTACSDADETPEPPAPPAGSVAPPDSGAATLGGSYSAPGALPAPRDTSLKAGEVGAPEYSKNVAVEIGEPTVKISHAEIPAGQVTFVMENKGTQPHALEIVVAYGGRWRTLPAAPGGSSSVTMVLGPGLYEAYCPLKHGSKMHRDSGGLTQFVVK